MSRTLPRQWNPAPVGVAAAMLCLVGCPFLPTAAGPPAQPATDLAALNVVAASARRLLVTPEENQSRSRLLALWVRLENTGSEALAFNPDDMTLTFADGTVGVTLDRAQANALIERLEVAPTDEAAAEFPDEWTLARRPALQPTLKRQLSEGLLAERVLGNEVMDGYILFDSKLRAVPLDGAMLEIIVVRKSDDAHLRQFYRFTSSQEPSASTAQP